MNVNKVGTNYVDPLLASLTQSQADSSATAGSSSSDISSLAGIMNTLQQLSQDDPDRFKQVMASVASTLQTDASNATGSQAQLLTQAADKFQQAAQTGSMTSLKPQSGGHHHHHHGVKSYSAQQSSGVGDPTQQQPFDLAQIIQGALQQAGVSDS